MLLLVLLLSGVVIGGLAAELCRGIPWLSWLSYGRELGIDTANPLLLDLLIVRVRLGIIFRLNVAELLGLFTSLIIFKKFF